MKAIGIFVFAAAILSGVFALGGVCACLYFSLHTGIDSLTAMM